MDKNKMIVIGVIAAVLFGGFVYMNVSQPSVPATVSETKNEIKSPPGVNGAKSMVEDEKPATGGSLIEKGEEMTEGKTVSVTLEAKSFSFSQKEIRVKKGDKVKITLVNKDGFHDWAVDGFNAKTKQLQVGQSDTIEFVADKTSTFEYYCSVGQHRANGMVGKLIVE